MLNKLYIIIALLLFIASCSATKKTQEAALNNPRPDWVMQKPISSSYYYGIGNANLNVHKNDFQQVAKNKALEDLSSEIEVSIDAQSVLSQKESNQAFIENYQATTRIDVKNNISNFEAVESWVDNNEYWVLYRLSKSEYKELQAELKEKAISKSLFFLDQSENEVEYKLQFEYLLQALDAIKPYLNDPLKTSRNSQTIYLGNFILSKIDDRLTKLKLIKSKNTILLEWSNCYTEAATFSLQYNGIPVENIPVRVKYNSYASQKLISDENGIIKFNLQINYYEEVPSLMNAWVSTSDLIKDPIIAGLFEKEYDSVTIEIKVNRPTVYITTSKDKGAFQDIINKAGAKTSQDSAMADVFLEAIFKLDAIGKTDDFYTSSCTIQMNVYNSQKNLIEQKIWPDVKGVHTNRMSADNKAIENAVKQIKYNWIQKLIMEHCRD